VRNAALCGPGYVRRHGVPEYGEQSGLATENRIFSRLQLAFSGVLDLTIPEHGIRLGDPPVFLISRDRLIPQNDYRVLITTTDPSYEPSCSLVTKTVIGTVSKETIRSLTGS
jgi:hypothetical protein